MRIPAAAYNGFFRIAGGCRSGRNHLFVLLFRDIEQVEAVVRYRSDAVVFHGDRTGQGVVVPEQASAVEAVEQVAGAKLLERDPIGAQDAVVDLRLNAVLHADIDDGGDARRRRLHGGAAEQQTGHPRRGRPDRPGLKPGNDVDERLHGHARQQRERRAENAEQDMDADGGAVAADVGKDPLCLLPHLPQ